MVHAVTYPHFRTLRSMWMNINVVPFETVIAIFCALSGVFGLLQLGLNNDQFASAMGRTIANVFNAGYILAGLGMLVGIALNRKDIEIFGLTCVVTSLLVRSSAIAWKVGLNPFIVTSYFFNALVIGACITRAVMIIKYKVLIQKIVKNG